jgi:hypothetical protein
MKILSGDRMAGFLKLYSEQSEAQQSKALDMTFRNIVS